MKLIGLSGHMGCGKNYIAEQIIYPHFKSSYNILIIGFGDLMKNELFARDLSLKYDDLYDHKTFETRNKLQHMELKMEEINIILIFGYVV